MSKTIPLPVRRPDGTIDSETHSAVIRDVKGFNAGTKRKLMRDLKGESESKFAISVEMTGGMIAALLESWTLPLPDPSNCEDFGLILDQLDLCTYNVLEEAAMPAVKVLFPNFEVSAAADSPTDSSVS